MTNTQRILAVDDNPTNLLILQEALQEQFTLEVALCGADALLVAPSFCPDVVLLDIMMPGMDGYEVCRRIKAHHDLRHCRVIMVSARTGIEDKLTGYDAGADDYVTKPFNEDELCAKVEFALRTKRLEQLCGPTGELLALVSELRGAETGVDLDRLKDYLHLLVKELRKGPYSAHIEERFTDDLCQASVLRDVGLLSVPKNLRGHPNTLSSDEREELKQHTLIGSRLMNRLALEHPAISVFRMAADVARSHHEQFDGSGYPDGLRGTLIPLAARIVKVADVIAEIQDNHDHASDSRGSSLVAARREIQRGRGSDYDPVIVDAFVTVVDEIKELYEQLLPAFAEQQAAR